MKEIINKKKKCPRCNGSGCGEPYDCHGEQYWHSCSDCHGDRFEHIKIYTKKEQAEINKQKAKEERIWKSYFKRRENYHDLKFLLNLDRKNKFTLRKYLIKKISKTRMSCNICNQIEYSTKNMLKHIIKEHRHISNNYRWELINNDAIYAIYGIDVP